MIAGVRTRLAAVIVLAAAAALLCRPLPAQAGGPTSVLLVAPGSEKATALYHSQPRYQQLYDAVQVSGEGKPEFTPYPNDFIVATWLIHDASVWRIDRIFMDAAGGPWIATENVLGEAKPPGVPVVSGKATWHKPANPEQLRGLLKTLGLYKATKAPAPGPAAPDPGAAAPAAPVAPAAPAAATAPAPGVGTGWWWALPGLLAGALIAFASIRLRQPRTSYEKQQELIG